MTLDLSIGAASKLEPFILMSKGAKGAAAAKLIQDATSAPGVFVFSELLDMPSIQELSKGDQASHYRLLQLFAYGTYEDYLNSKDSLPNLTPAQQTKLRLLTIISLSLDKRVLPYSLLLKSLQVPTIRELEDLIIDGIYLDLMRGKLDQKQQQFEVEYTIGRDLGPGKVESLLKSLQAWSRTTSAVLTTLDSQLAQVASQEVTTKQAQDEHDRQVNSILSDIAERRKETRRGGGGLGPIESDRENVAMDVDEPRAGGSGDPSLEPGKGRKKTIGPDHGKPSSRKRNRF